MTRTRLTGLFLLALLCTPALARYAGAQVACISTCFDKRYRVAVDADGNGLPGPGDTLEYQVTFCNQVPIVPMRDRVCYSEDEIDALNAPGDLTLVEDPSQPGAGVFFRCDLDDAGRSSCAAPPGAVQDCTVTVTGDSLLVSSLQAQVDGCFTYYLWARVAAAPSASRICNQVRNHVGEATDDELSDDPDTPAANDPTCFEVVPFAPLLFRASAPADRTPPWAYTTPCPGADPRLAGVPSPGGVASDVDIEPLGTPAGPGLVLFQLACPEARPVHLSKNLAGTPPALHLTY